MNVLGKVDDGNTETNSMKEKKRSIYDSSSGNAGGSGSTVK